MVPVAVEALQVWKWLQWRLPPAVWMEAQQALHPDQPTPQNAQLAQGLATILNPATMLATRLQLLRDLLVLIKNAGLDPGSVNDGGDSKNPPPR